MCTSSPTTGAKAGLESGACRLKQTTMMTLSTLSTTSLPGGKSVGEARPVSSFSVARGYTLRSIFKDDGMVTVDYKRHDSPVSTAGVSLPPL